MDILETHIVPEGVAGIRLSDYAGGVFTAIPSRKGMKKAIGRGEVRIDGRIATTADRLQPGQRIDLLTTSRRPPRPCPLPLEIVAEDDWLAVVVKPAGLVVSGNQYRTLENVLVAQLAPSRQQDALPWPHPVHRLDAPTGGLVIAAKTVGAEHHLRRQFAEQSVHKRYRAVVIGQTPEAGRMEKPLAGKAARTDFRLVRQTRSIRNEWLSLLDLRPHTGRTHQLRRHLSEAGWPILGDGPYGREGLILRGRGLFLQAVELAFRHPEREEMLHCQIAEPPKFQKFMEREEKRWKRSVNSL